jgi:hypothetical protein
LPAEICAANTSVGGTQAAIRLPAADAAGAQAPRQLRQPAETAEMSASRPYSFMWEPLGATPSDPHVDVDCALDGLHTWKRQGEYQASITRQAGDHTDPVEPLMT